MAHRALINTNTVMPFIRYFAINGIFKLKDTLFTIGIIIIVKIMIALRS